MMYRVVLCGVCAVFLLVAGCGKDSGETGSLNVKVSTASKVTAGIAMTLPAGAPLAKALGTALDVDLSDSLSCVSFTPSSYKVKIVGVQVFNQWVQNPDGEWIGGGKEIGAQMDRDIELVGRDRVNLLADETFTYDSMSFGTYIGVKVLMTDSVFVSGALSVNGVETSFSNVLLPLPFSGVCYRLPEDQQIIIDAESQTTLELIFDIEHTLLALSNGRFESVKAADSLYLNAGSPVIVPYVGTSTATVQKFELSFTGVPGPDASTWHLKGIAIQNSAGDMVNIGWQLVYHNGYVAVDGGVQMEQPRVPIIEKNADGSYNVGTDYMFQEKPEYMMGLRLSGLKFTDGFTGNALMHGRTDSLAVTYTVKLP
jgi:hypothetical protein